jgi:hypothetical protein
MLRESPERSAKVGKWYWSTRGEGVGFDGPYETREEAIAEARAENAERIFVGEAHEVEVEVSGDRVIEDWACQGHDLLYEDALDHWCEVITPEEMDDLSRELTAVFKKHLQKWGERTTWDVISDPVEVPAQTEGEGAGNAGA